MTIIALRWFWVLVLVVISNIAASRVIHAEIRLDNIIGTDMPLTADEITILQHMLIEDEGMRQFPYLDCCGKEFKACSCTCKGKITIGIGRNLTDTGISENEAIGLQYNDVKRVSEQLTREFPWFSRINSTRRIVVVSMAFNLGMEGFRKFKKTIKCIESGDFNSAADQMLISPWAKQVGKRSLRLSEMMRKGFI